MAKAFWTGFARVSLAALGFTVMYLEGTHNPQPGIWFAVGGAAVVLATLPWKAQ